MKLSIVYFNDVHGYMEEHAEIFYEGSKEMVKTVGGYSRLAAFIQSVRQDNPYALVFDGGDTFHGTYPAVQTKGEILLPVLNQLGIAAMVGHWDFGYGPTQLLHLASKLNYPVLGINVYKNDGGLLLPPYLIQKAGDLSVGIIGICSNIIDKTMPRHFSEDIRVTNGDEELPGYIREVREKGVDLVVLLSHNGFSQDCAMISKTAGIDLCLSAHTHNRIQEAVTVNETFIVQCGCHGSFAGHLELNVEHKKITDFSYRLVPMDEAIPKDPFLEQQIQQALQEFRHLNEQTVGETPQLLHRYNVLNSTTDNLLLAAVAHSTDCKVAFSNGWRYGAPMPKGPVTMNDLFNIVPMNPPVSTVELTGQEIKEMLEENLESTFSCDPMRQMGGYLKRCFGILVCFKIENPTGHRIQELWIDGEPYRKNSRYKAAFVTQQGVPEKYGINRNQLTIKAVEAMANFLRENRLTENVANQVAYIAV